ncbi:MAG: hypothetical protein DI537_60915, partial [Stutzerimonas stutzeri]
MKPEFITFTGIDERTDLNALASLSGRYPIEWAILFSRNRQGIDNRYPTIAIIERVFEMKEKADLRLAAHLCGKYAQDIMLGDFDRSSLPLGPFSRIQVNHTNPEPSRLRAIAIEGQDIIAQWRDPESFPTEYQGVSWLYDPSGGRGKSPDAWPENRGDRIVGYAGGINPQNAEFISTLVGGKSPAGYWLDMETGVRTDDGR